MDGAYHLHFDDESSGEAYAMSVRPKTTRKVQQLTVIDSELVVVVVIREAKRNQQTLQPEKVHVVRSRDRILQARLLRRRWIQERETAKGMFNSDDESSGGGI